MKFADLHHYFDWCSAIERAWRARVRINPKSAKAERSLEAFHARYPDHVVNLAQWRINRVRRQAASRASPARALGA